MHKHGIVLFRVIVLLLILNVLTVVSPACERFAPIQIENKTNEVLTIYIEGSRLGDVKPNDIIKNYAANLGWDWYTIIAYDPQGNVVYSHKFTDEEIKQINWKVVITDNRTQ